MSGDDSSSSPAKRRERPSRRALLGGGLAASTLAAAGGYLVGGSSGANDHVADSAAPKSADTNRSYPKVSPFGIHQPGVAHPDPRQAHLAVCIFDLELPGTAPDIADALGRLAVDLQDSAKLNGLDPASLTLTVGVGPRVVQDCLGSDSPEIGPLPIFESDSFSDENRDGDLLVQICAEEQSVVALAEASTRSVVEGGKVRWRAHGFRGKVDNGIGRNLLGFHDGISIPRTDTEASETVWLSSPPLTGSTIAVVRRIAIDVAGFGNQHLTEQEDAIGRRRSSGAPLSGGQMRDDPDLHAKSPEGDFAIGNSAHVRRAHPLPSGAAGLMLRRSYSYYEDPDDQGLLFISFQNDLDTFIKTQYRLDKGDALMDFTTTTHSGSFLILPGFEGGRALGDGLRRD